MCDIILKIYCRRIKGGLTMDALQIANSLPMWIACGLAVGLVVVQAAVFAKGAYSAGKKWDLQTNR